MINFFPTSNGLIVNTTFKQNYSVNSALRSIAILGRTQDYCPSKLKSKYKYLASINPIMDIWHGTFFFNGFAFCDIVWSKRSKTVSLGPINV